MRYLELGKFTETESRIVVVRGRGKGEQELLFNGYGVST